MIVTGLYDQQATDDVLMNQLEQNCATQILAPVPCKTLTSRSEDRSEDERLDGSLASEKIAADHHIVWEVSGDQCGLARCPIEP